MSKKPEDVSPQVDDFEEITKANQQSMQTVLKSYNTWLQNACRVQTEMLRFINKRIRAEMEMPTRFADCKNPADVVERQMTFARMMFEDYADEGRKMLDLMTEAAHEVQHEVDTAFKEQRQQ